jgi:hypothetical protein
MDWWSLDESIMLDYLPEFVYDRTLHCSTKLV